MGKKKRQSKPKVKQGQGRQSGRRGFQESSARGAKLLEEAFNHHQKGDLVAAEEGYRQILKVEPKNANCLHLMGVLALEKGDNKRAEKYIRSAIASYGKEPLFYKNLGVALRRQGLISEAIEQFRKVIKVNPGDTGALINCGTALKDQGDLHGAKDCFEKAISQAPSSAEAYYNLGTVFQDQARLADAIDAFETALSLKPDFSIAQANLLFNLNYHFQLEPSHLTEIHKTLAGNLLGTLNPPLLPEKDYAPEKVLKIGYVSPDFRHHSVAFFFLPIVEHHDRSKVMVYAYGDVDTPDEITEEIAHKADVWRNVKAMDDKSLLQKIREDEIDILVDLAGYSANNRMVMFSHRVAPIQVNYLGYPCTTGLSTMDYRISDNYADPPGESEQLFTEKLARLPSHFLCYRNPKESPQLVEPPAKAKGRVTFGSFNNGLKMNPMVIELWSNILCRVEGAQLLLKAKHFRDKGIVEEWKEMFVCQGVAPENLLFYGHTLASDDHLALYNSMDIALDTFPYNGTTTTCEALWMGVPVITLCGNHHAARVSRTILEAVGLQKCITYSAEDYCQYAVDLAANLDLLSELRGTLRSTMGASLLMSDRPFVNDLEDLYQQMWKGYIGS